MENEITGKRGFILILVIATMVVFIGLVWLIARNVPWNLLNIPSPSSTAGLPSTGMNCTYPVSYWGLHPELYPPRVVLGSETYQAKDIEGILTGRVQNVSAELERQLVGVFLNISAGANQGPIEATVFQAYGWLEQHQNGIQISGGELEAGSGLYNALKAYNLGLSGVFACPGAATFVMTETNLPSGSLAVPLTDTHTQTSTPTPSTTPTPISIATTVVPSQTSKPTTEAPQEPSETDTPVKIPEEPTATQTSAPVPTDTPTTIVAPPTSTFTQPPPPTPTFTLPPLPTETYTPPPPP